MSIIDQTRELEATFIAHRLQLRSAAQKIVGQRDLADEVTQEAYFKLTDSALAAKVQQPLAYCFQVVRNLAIDHRRRMNFESNVFTGEDEGMNVPTSQATPEQHAINRQNLSLIDKVLAGLPQRTRQAFEMYRLNGLTQRDIGQKLGVSAALVNAMIREATDALMHCRHMLAAD